jgi:hypothetical protein
MKYWQLSTPTNKLGLTLVYLNLFYFCTHLCTDLKSKFQPKFQIPSLRSVANQPCAISFSCESFIDLHLVTFIVFFSSFISFAHCFSSSHSPSLHCFLLSFSLFELLRFNGFQTCDFCNASYVLIKPSTFCWHLCVYININLPIAWDYLKVYFFPWFIMILLYKEWNYLDYNL